MLKTDNANMNINGTITHENEVLAVVNGNYNGHNEVYFNMTVQNFEKAKENAATLTADMGDFINQIFATITDLNNND